MDGSNSIAATNSRERALLFHFLMCLFDISVYLPLVFIFISDIFLGIFMYDPGFYSVILRAT